MSFATVGRRKTRNLPRRCGSCGGTGGVVATTDGDLCTACHVARPDDADKLPTRVSRATSSGVARAPHVGDTFELCGIKWTVVEVDHDQGDVRIRGAGGQWGHIGLTGREWG